MAKNCNCGPKDPVEPLINTQSFVAHPVARQIGFGFHVYKREVKLIPAKRHLDSIASTSFCYPVSGCEVIFAGESRNGDTWH